MKRKLCAFMLLGTMAFLTACGISINIDNGKTAKEESEEIQTPESETETETKDEAEVESADTSSWRTIEGEGYIFKLPSIFTAEGTIEEQNAIISQTADAVCTVKAFDIGFEDYSEKTLPKNADDINYSERDGVVRETIYFDYDENDNFEEYTSFIKYTYTKDSEEYQLEDKYREAKNGKLEPGDEGYITMSDEIVTYRGTKVIVNNNNREQAIGLLITTSERMVYAYGKEAVDPELMKQILDTFEWKDN